MRIRRIIAGLGLGALSVAGLVAAPALLAQTGAPQRAAPQRASQIAGIGTFTPASADPRLAAALARSGLSGSGFRFTPADTRGTNHRSVTTYLHRMQTGQSPVADTDVLPPIDRAREMLVFRLRMLEGITRQEFLDRTGFELDTVAGKPLRKFTALGLLEDGGDRIRLTREGLLVSDALWPEFL